MRSAATRTLARVAGIRIERSIVGVFMIHGFFAGIAAVLFATQLQVIQSTVPPNLELTVITAAVVGGVSILGRHRYGGRIDPGRDPVAGDRLGADLHQCLGLLAARGAGPAHSGDGAGRYGPAPAVAVKGRP